MEFKEFIQNLWGTGVEGYLEIRAISLNGSVDREFIPANNLNGVDPFVNERKHKNLYFGVCPRKEKAGTIDAVREVRTLWVDIDYKDTSKEEVRKRAEEFLLTPSLLVLSGGGVHIYFPLDEPFKIDSEADKAYIRALLRKLASYWGGDFASTDLARILRIPGSFNYKYDPPRKVKLVVKDSEQKFNLSSGSSDFDFLGVDYEKIKENLRKEKEGRLHWSEKKKYPGEVVDVMVKKCEFIRHCVEDAKTLSEPHWWSMITNLAAVEGGDKAIHKFSSPYPGYSRAETDTKIERAEENFSRGIGPHTCDYISTLFECPKKCELRKFGTTPVSAAFSFLKGGKGNFWGEEERKAEIIYVSSLLKGKRKKIDKSLLRNFSKVVEMFEWKGKEKAEEVFDKLLSENSEREIAKSYHDFSESEEAMEKLRIARLRFSLFMSLRKLEEEVRESKDIFALMDKLAEELIEAEEEMDFWRGEVNKNSLPFRIGKIDVVSTDIRKAIENALEKEKDFDALVLFSKVLSRKFLLRFLPSKEILPERVYSFGVERGGEGRFWAVLRGLKGYKVLSVCVFTYPEDRSSIFSITSRTVQFADYSLVALLGTGKNIGDVKEEISILRREMSIEEKREVKNKKSQKEINLETGTQEKTAEKI